MYIFKYRQLYLCDNFLYESYNFSYKLVGYVPLSWAEISILNCYFPFEKYHRTNSSNNFSSFQTESTSTATQGSQELGLGIELGLSNSMTQNLNNMHNNIHTTVIQ